MKTITYNMNDGSDDSGNGDAIILNNPERLVEAATSIQSVMTMHQELQQLKNDLMNDLHLAWTGDSKVSFDNYMDFVQKFLEDLSNPLHEFKSVLDGVALLVNELNGSTPTPKRTADGVQIP